MKRTARIGIRLLPEEKNLIEQRADFYGLSVSDYLRVLALTHVLTVSGHAPELQVPTLP